MRIKRTETEQGQQKGYKRCAKIPKQYPRLTTTVDGTAKAAEATKWGELYSRHISDNQITQQRQQR